MSAVVPCRPSARSGLASYCRFSLRGLLLFMLLVSLPLAWRGNTCYVARQRTVALQMVNESQARLGYRSYYCDWHPTRTSSGPTWWNLLLGDPVGDSDLSGVEFSPVTSRCNDACAARLADLPELTSIRLPGQPITDRGLQRFARLRALQSLDLDGAQLTDQSLRVLARLPALERLQLNLTDVSDVGLQHLSRCKSLQTLELLDTEVTAAGVEQFRRALPHTNIRWRKAASAAHRAALQNALQRGAKITWEETTAPSLTKVTFGFSHYDKPNPQWIGSLADLARLAAIGGPLAAVIRGDDCPDEDFLAILQLPQLRELQLGARDEVRLLNAERIAAVAQLRNLEALTLEAYLDDDLDLAPLQVLNIQQLRLGAPLSQLQLETLSFLFPQLQRLEFSGLQPRDVPQLRKLRNCETLILDGLHYETAAEAVAVLESNASLKKLALFGTALNAATLRRLGTFTRLQKLYAGLDGYSPEEIARIGGQLPGELATLHDFHDFRHHNLPTLRAWLQADRVPLAHIHRLDDEEWD